MADVIADAALLGPADRDGDALVSLVSDGHPSVLTLRPYREAFELTDRSLD